MAGALKFGAAFSQARGGGDGGRKDGLIPQCGPASPPHVSGLPPRFTRATLGKPWSLSVPNNPASPHALGTCSCRSSPDGVTTTEPRRTPSASPRAGLGSRAMRLLTLLAFLAACARADQLPPPDLVPVAGLLAAGDALAALPSPAPGLSAEAQALASRTGGLAAPAGGGATPGAERAAALAARAEALRSPVLSSEERARLGQEASGGLSLQ